MLDLIAKAIIPHDKELLTAVAPHWEWISENGVPNVDSIMAEQDFWADTFNLVKDRSRGIGYSPAASQRTRVKDSKQKSRLVKAGRVNIPHRQSLAALAA